MCHQNVINFNAARGRHAVQLPDAADGILLKPVIGSCSKQTVGAHVRTMRASEYLKVVQEKVSWRVLQLRAGILDPLARG